jgi:hypothetical protein
VGASVHLNYEGKECGEVGELGALDQARWRAVGWMALAGCRRELMSAEELKESNTLEEEVTSSCS